MYCATRLTLLFVLISAIAGCGATPSAKTSGENGATQSKDSVTVLAAASTTNALDEIKTNFAKRSSAKVRTSCAASSALAQQIASGAEADVFISADVRWADFVESKVPVAKRRNLLGNRLVIVVPSESKLTLTKPEYLASAVVTHIALGDPDAVPAGKYAKQALTALDLWEKLKSKVVPAEDVRHALTYVETGAAEAGIVYATDAAISKKVRVVAEISARLSGPVQYPVLLLKRKGGSQAAEAFYDYLGTPEATEVFQKFGFIVLAVKPKTNP